MIELTEEEQYDTRRLCFICKRPFVKDVKGNYIKVRDHCHYTGKYRGVCHKI